MADTTTDRRGSPRYSLTLVAEVFELLNSTAQLVARSSEVSRGGCYIDTLNPLPPGTQIKIQLRSGDEVFDTEARVVYMCPGLGMGVHWGTKPSEKQFSILDRWLQEAARVEVI
jgi:PilZ domain